MPPHVPKKLITAYNILVYRHPEYASTYLNTCTKRSIDKLEAVQRMAVRFALNLYDYRLTADLIGKIQKSLQLDSWQHRRAITDLYTFDKIGNNFVNIAIPPMLLPSIKRNCHYSILSLRCLF